MAPIHDAASVGDVEALRRELERGVSPDARRKSWSYSSLLRLTVIMRTAYALLLRAGADPNANRMGRRTGRYTWQRATLVPRPLTSCMLLEAGASVNAKNALGLDGNGLRLHQTPPLFTRYYCAPAPSFHRGPGHPISAKTHT